MFVPVVADFQEYDFSALVAGGTQERQVGQFIATSGVKSGALVVRKGNIDIANHAGTPRIEVTVYAAWQDAVGALALDTTHTVAQVTFGIGTDDVVVLFRENFDSRLPTPGLVITVTGTMGSTVGSLVAELSIALELLPT